DGGAGFLAVAGEARLHAVPERPGDERRVRLAHDHYAAVARPAGPAHPDEVAAVGRVPQHLPEDGVAPPPQPRPPRLDLADEVAERCLAGVVALEHEPHDPLLRRRARGELDRLVARLPLAHVEHRAGPSAADRRAAVAERRLVAPVALRGGAPGAALRVPLDVLAVLAGDAAP